MQIAYLKLDPVGLTTQQVQVVKRTPKRVRIKAPCLVKTYWRDRPLMYGEELLVTPDRLVDPSSFGEPTGL